MMTLEKREAVAIRRALLWRLIFWPLLQVWLECNRRVGWDVVVIVAWQWPWQVFTHQETAVRFPYGSPACRVDWRGTTCREVNRGGQIENGKYR